MFLSIHNAISTFYNDLSGNSISYNVLGSMLQRLMSAGSFNWNVEKCLQRFCMGLSMNKLYLRYEKPFLSFLLSNQEIV